LGSSSTAVGGIAGPQKSPQQPLVDLGRLAGAKRLAVLLAHKEATTTTGGTRGASRGQAPPPLWSEFFKNILASVMVVIVISKWSF